MAITDKTRKLLWGRSGNRCAICKCELVMERVKSDGESVVGDECHIVAKEVDGPRGHEPVDVSADHYDNLILLCKVHHKLVDDQPNHYTASSLHRVKREHEHWVRSSLTVVSEDESGGAHGVLLLKRLSGGKELTGVIAGALAFEFDHDELQTQQEADMVGAFLQECQDWGDIWPEMEAGARVQAGFSMNNEIAALEEAGSAVFGAQASRKVSFAGKADTWPVAVIRVLRADNPGIVDTGKLIGEDLAHNQ